MILYSTTARVNNNSYTNFCHKLLLNTGSGFSDVDNSTFSGNTNRASYAKSTSTGVVLLNLNNGDQIKVAAAATHLTNTGGNDIVYITKDTSISIVDLFGGPQGETGIQGSTGYKEIKEILVIKGLLVHRVLQVVLVLRSLL